MASTVVTDSLNHEESKYLQAARRYQQNYYEICSDWNRYEIDELCYLRDFIGYAFFGLPDFEKKNLENKDHSNSEKGHCGYYVYNDEKKESAISLIHDKAIECGTSKEFEGILCSIIYNVIYNEEWSVEASKKEKSAKDEKEESKLKKKDEKECKKEDEKRGEKEDEQNEIFEAQVHPVPVLKVRRYEKTIKDGDNKSDDDKCESVKIYYIDNGGRVYTGFKDYLECNTLPACKMVLPKDGRYQMDPAFHSGPNSPLLNMNDVVTKVWLQVNDSPMANISSKILIGGDIATTIVTIASMGVTAAAMVTPIGAGITLAGTIGAGVCGLWSVGRSAHQLADRNQHGESISVTDKTALGAWIGVAGGTMGIAATGGTVLLTRAIRTGSTIGRTATIAYDAVVIGNLIVNGIGISYKGYDIIETMIKGEKPSAQDVLMLSVHMFFFYNSVVNIRLAQNFIETSQGQLLKDYEASLRSNRHRKEFQRLSRNTRAAASNDITGNEEIIRGINKINNKDDFFQAMVRNRKAFSASSAKASFSDGKVMVNSVLTIDPVEFSNLPKDVRVDIVKGVSTVKPNNTAFSDKTNVVRNNETTYKNFTANSNEILREFCVKHSSAMIQSAPPVIAHFANVLRDLREVQNWAEIFIKLLDIAYRILQAMPRDDELTTGDVIAEIVQFVWDYVKINLRQLRPESSIKDPSLRNLIGQLVNALIITVEDKAEIWVKAFKKWLRDEFPQSFNGPFRNKERRHEYA